MAKIALISQKITPHLEALAGALTFQKQDILIITSKSELAKVSPEWRAIAPFEKWSLTEAMKALPSLISQPCDVWHFIYSNSSLRPKPADWIIAGILHTLPRKVVAASFSDSGQVSGLFMNAFFKSLDLALFSKRSLLMKTKREHEFGDHPLTEVIPPLDLESIQTLGPVNDEMIRLTQSLHSSYLVVPDLHKAPEWIESSPLPIVVLRPGNKKYRHLKNVFFVGDNLQVSDLEHLLSCSRALCLAFGDYSPIELQRYHQWSERLKLPLIVTTGQTEEFPGLCWHQKSGWVLDNPGPELWRLLGSNPNLELDGNYETISRQDLMDSTLNELLRLYQKSYSQRWT